MVAGPPVGVIVAQMLYDTQVCKRSSAVSVGQQWSSGSPTNTNTNTYTKQRENDVRTNPPATDTIALHTQKHKAVQQQTTTAATTYVEVVHQRHDLSNRLEQPRHRPLNLRDAPGQSQDSASTHQWRQRPQHANVTHTHTTKLQTPNGKHHTSTSTTPTTTNHALRLL